MKLTTAVACAFLILGSCRTTSTRVAPGALERPPFDAVFTGGTLRVDCHHVGNAKEEHFAVALVRAEGAWPGSRTQLVDESDMGLYRFEVRALADGRVLYSRGYCSIFGEWQSTAAAKSGWGSFEESQRFPEPRTPVDLVWHKRRDDGSWTEVARASVDPASRFVDRAPLATDAEVIPVFEHGAPATKVDLLVVADGYPAGERAKFEEVARGLIDVMFATEPFRRRRGDFNVRLLYTPAAESGLSNPRKNAWRQSRFGLSFNSFDVDRYVLAMHDRELREACAQAPYDALILLCNERKYGGGGIYNLWATATADSEAAPYLFVHEFGHSFAGLADEYYSSTVAYEELTPPGTEPWEPNATALLDPKQLKWRDLVAPGTALPTAWNKAQYDADDLVYQAKRKALIDAQASEDENEKLMREVKQTSSAFLKAEPNYGKVGAFEGAAYLSRGLYRPEVDCIMFTRNPTSFCKVCERAVERTIDGFAR
ncbi:MAG: peptidase M64 [Planctomycetota bacterium]|nr:MAG: peptidase M64 [Planctomycetota bacterium]